MAEKSTFTTFTMSGRAVGSQRNMLRTSHGSRYSGGVEGLDGAVVVARLEGNAALARHRVKVLTWTSIREEAGIEGRTT